MTEQGIDSATFQNAQLRSERYRIIAVIAFVSFFTAVVALRIVIYGSKMNPWGIVAMVLLIAYEFVGLRTVDRSLRARSFVPACGF
jgi:hypothetical protein